jgi:hypothetical protein
VLGKPVIAGDRPSVRGRDKRNGRAFSCVLPCLSVQIGVKCRNPAGKSRSMVLVAERLDCKSSLFLFWAQLEPHVLSIPLRGMTSSIGGSWRVQNSFYENFASLITKLQYVEVLDCGSGGFLRTRDHEFRDRGSTQRRAARSIRRFCAGVILASKRSAFRWTCGITTSFIFVGVRLLDVHVKRKERRIAGTFPAKNNNRH